MKDSWEEHRLLVLALLERHDDQLKECEDNYHKQREECQGRIAVMKADINARMDSRFDAFNRMHAETVSKAKAEILEGLKEPAEVTVAKITKRWEFWAVAISQGAAIIIALIALLN
jgi:hypothetical protein